MVITRRRFLKYGALGCLAVFSPFPALGTVIRPISKPRHLSLYNVHTGEYLNACFRTPDGYCEQTLNDINHLLRDRRTNEVKTIDISLLELMYELSRQLITNRPFHIISGYRSKASNDLLRKRNRNVARKSLHLQGKAVDIRIPGFSTSAVRWVAASIKGGGVGYYPQSNFIHLDTGRVRYW